MSVASRRFDPHSGPTPAKRPEQVSVDATGLLQGLPSPKGVRSGSGNLNRRSSTCATAMFLLRRRSQQVHADYDQGGETLRKILIGTPGCLPRQGNDPIVTSAMGQPKHPVWSYNMEPNPAVETQIPGERFRAHARVLDNSKKQASWSSVREQRSQCQSTKQALIAIFGSIR